MERRRWRRGGGGRRNGVRKSKKRERRERGMREGEFNIHMHPKPLTWVLHCVNSASALCFAVLPFAISVTYEPSLSEGGGHIHNLIATSGVEGNFQLEIR